MESSAIRELGARLRERGNELEKEFKDRDPESKGMKNILVIQTQNKNVLLLPVQFLGIISLSKWCEAMEAATKLGLPWRLLRDKLAPPETDSVNTDVNYRKTLEMLDTDLIVRFRIGLIIPIFQFFFSLQKTAHAGSTSVADSLYKNKSSLEVIFRILDKDNSGSIIGNIHFERI